jgi:hypothetical protein
VAYGTAVVAPRGRCLTVPDGPPPVPVSPFGDADRDRLTVVLREHYALGRIDIDEFARRVEIVLAADYADEAAAAVRDLPPLGAGRPRRRGRARPGGPQANAAAACASRGGAPWLAADVRAVPRSDFWHDHARLARSGGPEQALRAGRRELTGTYQGCGHSSPNLNR